MLTQECESVKSESRDAARGCLLAYQSASQPTSYSGWLIGWCVASNLPTICTQREPVYDVCMVCLTFFCLLGLHPIYLPYVPRESLRMMYAWFAYLFFFFLNLPGVQPVYLPTYPMRASYFFQTYHGYDRCTYQPTQWSLFYFASFRQACQRQSLLKLAK